MKQYLYLLTPLFAWFITGCTKFAINCLKERRLAFDLIGYGGMPSNHSAIVSSIATMIALREGIYSPAFGVAIALAFIVMLDANSLRQKIGQQARLLNQVSANLNLTNKPLRERMGHSKFEILAGIVSGCVSAYLLLILIG